MNCALRSLRLRPFAGSRLQRDRPSRQREIVRENIGSQSRQPAATRRGGLLASFADSSAGCALKTPLSFHLLLLTFYFITFYFGSESRRPAAAPGRRAARCSRASSPATVCRDKIARPHYPSFIIHCSTTAPHRLFPAEKRADRKIWLLLHLNPLGNGMVG